MNLVKMPFLVKMLEILGLGQGIHALPSSSDMYFGKYKPNKKGKYPKATIHQDPIHENSNLACTPFYEHTGEIANHVDL